MKPIIYLDLDGVLADFCTAVCKVLNATYPSQWPQNTYSIADALGITEGEMWKAIDKEGYQFWANLEPYPYAKELYERLQSEYEVFFCSTPSQDPQSLYGKLLWLNKLTGTNCRNYIFTPNKFLLANESTILIDDFCRNVDQFQDNNGYSILFPADWNLNYIYKEDPVGFVFEALENIKKSM